MSKDQLIENFNALVKEHGHDWAKIASLLNDRNIPTTTGGKWDRDKTRSFYRRHVTQERASGRADKVSPPQTAPAASKSFPDWLDAKAQADLTDLLEWWRNTKGEPSRGIPTRPTFRGKRRNTGIHCNDELLKRVMKKLKADKVRTGGSLSLLTEILYWEYLGRPEDVLEPLSPDSEPSLETDT